MRAPGDPVGGVPGQVMGMPGGMQVASLRVFGFPVHVRAGFVLFLALVIVVNGGPLGWWIAGSAAVLTLLHELGHAVAARLTGSHAEISLDFLAGYASFAPSRPLAHWERAAISAAGPAVQIAVGCAALVALGADPFDHRSVAEHPATLAIWWTGPVIGLFNLVPVLPLDGGHIVQAALDRVLPRRSREVMLWSSIAVTAAVGVWLMATPDRSRFAAFVVVPLVMQLQLLESMRRRARPAEQPPETSALERAGTAEAIAWRTGDVGGFPPGWLPSPWFRAAQQLAQGDPQTARDLLLADLAETGPRDWFPPVVAPPDRLAGLVALLPRPLPHGRPASEHVLAEVLLRTGDARLAAEYAAASYARQRVPAPAFTVARAATALGALDVAAAWVEAARQVGATDDDVAAALGTEPPAAVPTGDQPSADTPRRT